MNARYTFSKWKSVSIEWRLYAALQLRQHYLPRAAPMSVFSKMRDVCDHSLSFCCLTGNFTNTSAPTGGAHWTSTTSQPHNSQSNNQSVSYNRNGPTNSSTSRGARQLPDSASARMVGTERLVVKRPVYLPLGASLSLIYNRKVPRQTLSSGRPTFASAWTLQLLLS